MAKLLTIIGITLLAFQAYLVYSLYESHKQLHDSICFPLVTKEYYEKYKEYCAG